MDNKLLAPSDVAEIAKLPTLEEAGQKLLEFYKPQQKLIGILLAPGRKIANLAPLKV